MTAQNKHYPVAFFNAQRPEIICRFVCKAHHVRKSERFFFVMFANPQKRGFIGGVFAPEIHHVKPEVEVVGNMKIDFCQSARFFVNGFGNVFFVKLHIFILIK